MNNLSESCTTIGNGSLGYIGFCDDNEQSADLRVLKLWLYVFDTGYTAEEWQDILKHLFNTIEWDTEDGFGATITIQLKEPLVNANGLLESLADQIKSRVDRWVYYTIDDHLSKTAGQYLIDDEYPEEDEPQLVYFTEGPCGHHGYE